MDGQRIVLAGGSGFIGQSLAARLAASGYEVVVLTRSPGGRTDLGTSVRWDGKTLGDWTKYLDGALAVVNLAGKSVNCRYTPDARRHIIDSRVDSVHVVAEAVRRCRRPPQSFVQASSLAIYGDAGERLCDESAPPGTGFAAEVCQRWEEAFQSSPTPDTRRVLLRIGFALGAEGGALKTLAALARWFMGGATGSGRQYISWLHVADLNRMFLDSMTRADIAGVYNATGPQPVTNAEFMRQLRRVLRRPWSPPVPAWAVRIGAWLMGTDASLALTGRRSGPRRFLDQAFSFEFAELRAALQDLLPRHPR
jgi:uncharacterized protein (TIGR01777 family)